MPLKLLLAFCLVFLLGCGSKNKGTDSNRAVGYGTLDGFVYSTDTEQALEDVQVSCDGKTSFTNEWGYYKIENIKQGSRKVKASKPDYRPFIGVVSIGAYTTRIIYLSPDYPNAPQQRDLAVDELQQP